MEGDLASTQRIASDADIIKATLDAKPTLVSIDSPLSLPKGRVSVSDDDPGRQEYGITRHCERALKKRGINVYPCLIQSMQGLTARGMRLAVQLRSLGVPVIESYPGAAQDIMKIPRKRAGLEFLKDGLAEFGIKGNYTKDAVSHDELDAITSALVGVFFWSGKFEALGNEEEEYLIIPDIENTVPGWREAKSYWPKRSYRVRENDRWRIPQIPKFLLRPVPALFSRIFYHDRGGYSHPQDTAETRRKRSIKALANVGCAKHCLGSFPRRAIS